MEPEENLPQQDNQLYPEKEEVQETNKDGQEILDGARKTDQLDQFNKNVPEGGRDNYPELQQGAQPSEGDK